MWRAERASCKLPTKQPETAQERNQNTQCTNSHLLQSFLPIPDGENETGVTNVYLIRFTDHWCQKVIFYFEKFSVEVNMGPNTIHLS